MPRLVTAPVTVVEEPGKVKIDEFFGGASCNPCPAQAPISVAHVKAKAGFAEDWQAPAFDEYVLVLKGAVTLEHAHGDAVKVGAGQAVFLPKGERVRWVFNEDAEYVPICLPAFSPFNVYREEGGEKRPDHDKHTNIYHCVQKPLWEECKASGKTYYPPTYEADGFTHATADPAFLIGVLNHFYKDTTASGSSRRPARRSSRPTSPSNLRTHRPWATRPLSARSSRAASASHTFMAASRRRAWSSRSA